LENETKRNETKRKNGKFSEIKRNGTEENYKIKKQKNLFGNVICVFFLSSPAKTWVRDPQSEGATEPTIIYGADFS
jgi:hypothetical protein